LDHTDVSTEQLQAPAKNSAAPVPAPVPAARDPLPQQHVAGKVDGQADAFAKFLKRVGKDGLSLEPDKARSPSPNAVGGHTDVAAGGLGGDMPSERSPTVRPSAPPEDGSEPTKEGPSGKEKEKDAVWPVPQTTRRALEREPKKAAAPEKAEEDVKSSSKMSFGLPPPGTVTKPKPTEEAANDVPAADDDGERVQEVSPLDHRFVGLVIGKAGETIKSFKKQSGASIEIDQNLPDGMPRVVIYRGTRKQVAAAKKLVDGLVQRAKEDEKSKNGGVPIGSGMGIMGRGPGECKEKEGSIVPDKGRPDEVARSELPPWRRSKPGEEEQRAPAAEVRGPPRSNNAARRDVPWAKREKECEAAPSGSLTGSLSADAKLSMRPAWMKPSKASGDPDDGGLLSVFDRSSWHEQRYSRSLLLQAQQKILRMKAYEVPEEMMTMTTGPRPKWKPDRREKDSTMDEANHKELGAAPAAAVCKESEPCSASPALVSEVVQLSTASSGGEQGTSPEMVPEKQPSRHVGNVPAAVGGPFENLPGDSKDIMKLKKKLREIQKIEDSISAGELVEPNQREKVTKKVGYLEELHVLESIVHSPPVGGSGGP